MQLCSREARVVILAGPGGNGGGGLSGARHLHNHGYDVDIVLSRETDVLRGPAKAQLDILEQSGLATSSATALDTLLGEACLIIDALLGYSLRGAPRGVIRDLIQASNESSLPILSLDLPSGIDATDGGAPGEVITPTRTLTLALPKQGLANIPGRLFLADIGIPPELYEQIGLLIDPIFSDRYWLELQSIPPDRQP
jgi:NAD(P)H-hydrate epimerase